MKRKETMFFKALGEIPESYIDELTQWQLESEHNKPARRSVELPDPKEETIMKQNAQFSTDKNKEAGISVKKLRPITIGIFASLAACGVIAAGLGSKLFGQRTPDVQPAVSVTEDSETESVVSEEEGVPATEFVDDGTTPDDSTTNTETVSEEDRVWDEFSCYGDDSETGGIPEIPADSAMLFTNMDDLRPLLERATNTDFPVKGIDHAQSCFNSGRNLLIIKQNWMLDSYDHMIRSLAISADNHIFADIACYLNQNTEPGLDANAIKYCYMFVSVPGSVQEISGSSLQQTMYYSNHEGGVENDPLREEMNHYFDDGVYLKHLEYNSTDYIFPDMAMELYAPEAMDGEKSAWMLGSYLVNMNGDGLPASVKDYAMDMIDINLNQLDKNCLVGMNSVQGGALPYISVYNSMEQSVYPRRLIFPELKYEGIADDGMRMTILYAPELTATAEIIAPPETPLREEPALPHSDGHPNHLAISCNQGESTTTSAEN